MELFKQNPCYWKLSKTNQQILVPVSRSVSFEMASDCKTMAYIGDPHLREKYEIGQTFSAPNDGPAVPIFFFIKKYFFHGNFLFQDPLCSMKSLGPTENLVSTENFHCKPTGFENQIFHGPKIFRGIKVFHGTRGFRDWKKKILN